MNSDAINVRYITVYKHMNEPVLEAEAMTLLSLWPGPPPSTSWDRVIFISAAREALL